LVDAVWTAAAWDREYGSDTNWVQQREAIRESKNDYLRAIALWFLKEQTTENVDAQLAEKEVAHALRAKATCGPTRR
jgi:hypothetical protein